MHNVGNNCWWYDRLKQGLSSLSVFQVLLNLVILDRQVFLKLQISHQNMAEGNIKFNLKLRSNQGQRMLNPPTCTILQTIFSSDLYIYSVLLDLLNIVLYLHFTPQSRPTYDEFTTLSHI